jgi:hypothetical protein
VNTQLFHHCRRPSIHFDLMTGGGRCVSAGLRKGGVTVGVAPDVLAILLALHFRAAMRLLIVCIILLAVFAPS